MSEQQDTPGPAGNGAAAAPREAPRLQRHYMETVRNELAKVRRPFSILNSSFAI